MGCAIRPFVALLVLVGLVLAAGSAAEAAWADAALGAIGWGAVAGGIGARADALLTGIGQAAVGAVAWGWDRAAAVPWQAALGTGAGFVGDLARGVGIIIAAAAGLLADGVAAAADGIAALARAAWAGAADRFAALTRAPSGEPLDGGRLTVLALGWLIVAALLAWLLLRRIFGWVAAAWRCATSRRSSNRRRASAA